jgi:hypothetical protein
LIVIEVQGEIIRRMCEGESLRAICRTEGYPAPSTVILWTNNDPAFAEQYARARDERADVYFDRIDDVSDAAASAETAVEVAGLRLKADNIKWQLARMAPKKYGDKLELGGGLDINNRIERITRKIVDSSGTGPRDA